MARRRNNIKVVVLICLLIGLGLYAGVVVWALYLVGGL